MNLQLSAKCVIRSNRCLSRRVSARATHGIGVTLAVLCSLFASYDTDSVIASEETRQALGSSSRDRVPQDPRGHQQQVGEAQGAAVPKPLAKQRPDPPCLPAHSLQVTAISGVVVGLPGQSRASQGQGEGTRTTRHVVAVRALAPYKRQAEAYRAAFAEMPGFEFQRDVPQYVLFLAERATLRPGADTLQWNRVASSDSQRLLLLRSDWIRLSEEIADARYSSFVLTMPVPVLSASQLESSALHSQVPKRGTQSTKPDAAGVDHLLVRFFDYSVTPGASYRYRVQLLLEDPNHPKDPGMQPPERLLHRSVQTRLMTVAEEETTSGRRIYWRRSPWSEPSDVVTVDSAPSARAADMTTRPITRAERVIAVYCTPAGMSGGSTTMVLAVWGDGHIVWSEDHVRGGPPYRRATLDESRLSIFSKLEAGGVFFDDKLKPLTRVFPDGDTQKILIRCNGQQLELSSDRDLYPEIRQGTCNVPEPGRESREALYFGTVWTRLRNAAGDLIPLAGEPCVGALVLQEGGLSWMELQQSLRIR